MGPENETLQDRPLGIIGPRQALKLLDYCRFKSEADRSGARLTWVRRYMLVHLALATGLRVSEIGNLRVGQVKLTPPEPYLTVEHSRRGRTVYLDTRLVAHLRRFLAWEEARSGRPPAARDFVLQNQRGTRYTNRALEFSFKKAIVEAGLNPRYSIHSARHAYGALLLALTGDLDLVRCQMGHSSPRITAVYTDTLPEEELGLIEEILTTPLGGQVWYPVDQKFPL